MRRAILALVVTVACQVGTPVPPKLPVTGASAIPGPEEFGLCWNEGMNPWLRTAEEKCADGTMPQVVQFADLPITVAADSETYWATKLAVAVWNDTVGFELFSAHPLIEGITAPAADVVLRSVDQCRPGLAGATWFSRAERLLEFDNNLGGFHLGGTHYQANVKACPGFYYHSNMVIHELGHVLGLDHDDNIRSIMWPDLGSVLPVIEDTDVLLIQERYRHLR